MGGESLSRMRLTLRRLSTFPLPVVGSVEVLMFSCQLPLAARIHKPTPIVPASCAASYQSNMFGSSQLGYCYGQGEQPAVLDLRVSKAVQDDPVTGQLTPPRDEHCTTPPMSVVSPTLAITQRVLAAANQPQGTRPFKAYPKDPLSLTTAQDEAYMKFRDEMLSQVRGGKNAFSRKQPGSPNQTHSGGESDEKDAAYWERRRKNNEAAKRSRDARRAKEDEIAIRAAFLEQENLKLKYQIAAITEEYNHMRRMFYETRHHHTLQPIL